MGVPPDGAKVGQVAADETLERAREGAAGGFRLSRLPPGGHPLGREVLRALASPARAGLGADAPAPAIAARLGGGRVELYRSGRAALVAVFEALAARSGRDEVVVPAYTCYSVPAAAVAAGLRVRLVDVDRGGCVDADRLAALPLEHAAAVLVSNLFGLAEPLESVRAIAGARGCALIDDAAQAFGASDAQGPVGGRGDAGLLSFGRGKPLSALGGGGAWWPAGSPPVGTAPVSAPASLPGLARAVAYDLAMAGPVFRVLAAIPALHIGETIFDPGIERGGIADSARGLLGVALACAERNAEQRREAAARLSATIASATDFVPLQARAGTVGVHPRLALLAPDGARRDAALDALTRIGAGASPMYPQSLDRLAVLAPHLAAPADCPVARDMAARMITLPTHGRLRGRRLDDAIAVLVETSG